MKESKTKQLIRIAIIAALYVALTVSLSWISYGNIQFRVAEILIILCFFRKDYIYSLIIGCAISNLFSPMGIYDVIFGTLATVLASLSVGFIKKIEIGLFLTVIFNAVIIGIELNMILQLPFILSCIEVGIGELIVMIVGYFVYLALKNNKVFIELIKANQNLNK